jgi:FAD:protein FMN transferase
VAGDDRSPVGYGDAVPWPKRDRTVRAEQHGVLGTVLEIQVIPTRSLLSSVRFTAEGLLDNAMVCVDQQLRIFSIYDSASELCLWREKAEPGVATSVSPELASVLDRSARWQAAGGGSFNPMAGVFQTHWATAETTGECPNAELMAQIAASISTVPYRVAGATIECLGDCSMLTLNAFAKGHVADQVGAALWDTNRMERLLVNIGGDLRVWGGDMASPVRVGIEHPTRAVDNDEPIAVVEVLNAGLATSGSSRRGFVVGGQRFSHVIDPRTGWPIDSDRSATAIGPSAADADVIATIALVGGVDLAESAVELMGLRPVDIRVDRS